MSERKKKRRRKEILLSLASLPPSFSQPIIRRTIKMAKVLVLKIAAVASSTQLFCLPEKLFSPHCFFHIAANSYVAVVAAFAATGVRSIECLTG